MIAFDNADARRVLNGTTFSYTCGAGAHMFCMADNGVTAISYNGVALTAKTSFTSTIADGNGQTVNLFELTSPSTGINTVSVTAGANAYALAIVTYTGADTTQFDNSNNQFSNDTINNTQVATFTSSVTPNTDNCWAVMFISGGNNANRTFTGGAGTTLRASVGSLDTNSIGILDTNVAISPAALTSLVADWSSGTGFVTTITAAIKIPTSVSHDDNFFLL